MILASSDSDSAFMSLLAVAAFPSRCIILGIAYGRLLDSPRQTTLGIGWWCEAMKEVEKQADLSEPSWKPSKHLAQDHALFTLCDRHSSTLQHPPSSLNSASSC